MYPATVRVRGVVVVIVRVAAGLRDKVKVIVGGGVVTDKVKEYTGADAATTDAVEGIKICQQFVEGAS